MYTGSWHPVLRGCGREFFGTQFPHRKIKLRNELRITAKCLGSGWLATVTVKYSIVSCYPLVVWRSKVNNYEKHIFFFFGLLVLCLAILALCFRIKFWTQEVV